MNLGPGIRAAAKSDILATLKVVVVGAGYVGRRAAGLLADRGATVIATARSAASLESLRSAGFDARRLDLDDPETFSVLKDVDAVILCPAPSDPSADGYRAVYGEGIPRLCETLGSLPKRPRTVYTSSTSVLRTTGGETADESSPIETGEPKPAALAAAESAVRFTPLRGMVLRLAGIYGAERNRLGALEAGTLAPAAPDDIANLIHVDDAAAAAVFLLEHGADGEVYLGVDDAPTPRAEVYRWLAAECHLPDPALGGATSSSRRGGAKRCSNRKLASLGFQLRYPSYREGYHEILAARIPPSHA